MTAVRVAFGVPWPCWRLRASERFSARQSPKPVARETIGHAAVLRTLRITAATTLLISRSHSTELAIAIQNSQS